MQRTGLTYIDLAVCSENVLADFLPRLDCFISYKLLADFRANFCLYVDSFNSSDVFSHIKTAFNSSKNFEIESLITFTVH